MERIAIITDSTCDLPTEIVKEHNISVLPLRILYKDTEYRDAVEITPQQVYERLREEVPTTSLPLAEDVLGLYEALRQQGIAQVISIHLSSGLSGTGQMLTQLASEIKDMTIRVIDSKSISLGLGWTVLETAKAVQAGASFNAACAVAESMIQRVKVFFVLDTLEYLIKGGRIGRVSGSIGQFLNVKPIITINEDGIYTTVTKVRGRKQSLQKLISIAKEHLQRSLCNVGICHGSAPTQAEELKNELLSEKNLSQLLQGEVSPVIGVHTGPGTIGFAVYSVPTQS